MATVPMTNVLGRLRKAVLWDDGLTDAQLLARFIGQRDEAAFESLLRRHGPMVLGVCRRVLANEADAEDAFQATFLVLVRKAGSLTQRALVSNWLYGVAQRTALKAKAMISKRRAKENEAARTELAAATSDRRVEALLDEALLDDAIGRLPDKYRTLIVLCELESKPIREAARLLGCPPGTVASRLARARAMLAKRLGKKGLAVSGAVLAGALSQSAASAGLPAPLIVTTIKAATVMAAGQAATAGVISAHVLALTEGVLTAMLLSKLKIAALALVLIAAIGLGVAGSAYTQPPAGAGRAAQVETRPAQNRLRWEYKAVSRTDVEKLATQNSKSKLTDGLNVLGGDGWELVGIDQAAATSGMAGGFGAGFGGGGGGGAGFAPGGAPGAGPGGAPGAGPPGVGPGGFAGQPGGGGGGFRQQASSTYVFKRLK